VLRIRRAGRLALSLACFALALVPAAVAVSQHRIEGAQAALERGDCAKASSEAHGALDVVSFLPEPQQVLAYCAAQQGRMPEAVSLAREAVRHDPDNWRYHYDVALLTAASGGDPQPAAREAAALNPREPAAAVLPTVLGRPNARALALDLVTRRR
jgi:tetratricopeptide (TPR) repeat protein